MMYRKEIIHKELIGISVFKAFKHFILFQTQKQNNFYLIKYNLNTKELLHEKALKNKISNITIYNDRIVTNDIYGNLFLFSLADLSYLKSPEILSSRISGNNGYISGFRNKNGKRFYVVFDINKDKVIWEKEIQGRILYVSQDKIICHETEFLRKKNKRQYKKLELVCYPLQSDNLIWRRDLTKLGKFDASNTTRFNGHLRQLFSIEESTMLLLIYPADLVAIDIETGETKWESTELRNRYSGVPKNPGNNKFHYSKTGNKFIRLANNYVEFDLVSKTSTCSKIADSSKKWFIDKTLILDDDHMLFLGSFRPVVSNTLGIFNRKTLDVLWYYEFDESITTIPQILGDKIFVKDFSNNLHIFQKHLD